MSTKMRALFILIIVIIQSTAFAASEPSQPGIMGVCIRLLTAPFSKLRQEIKNYQTSQDYQRPPTVTETRARAREIFEAGFDPKIPEFFDSTNSGEIKPDPVGDWKSFVYSADKNKYVATRILITDHQTSTLYLRLGIDDSESRTLRPTSEGVETEKSESIGEFHFDGILYSVDGYVENDKIFIVTTSNKALTPEENSNGKTDPVYIERHQPFIKRWWTVLMGRPKPEVNYIQIWQINSQKTGEGTRQALLSRVGPLYSIDDDLTYATGRFTTQKTGNSYIMAYSHFSNKAYIIGPSGTRGIETFEVYSNGLTRRTLKDGTPVFTLRGDFTNPGVRLYEGIGPLVSMQFNHRPLAVIPELSMEAIKEALEVRRSVPKF